MPLLLDAYCGAGGAGMGYDYAGFDVVGVDIAAQPNYPFEFHKGDAIEFIREYGYLFDVIHASPPCQYYAAIGRSREKHADLVGPTRSALADSRKPYVMENIMSAPIHNDLTLCGEMFALKVIRHRKFEFNHDLVPQPKHLPHRGRAKQSGRKGRGDNNPGVGYYVSVYGNTNVSKGSVPEWQAGMGIHWTADGKELSEAIPPAYTRYIGTHVMAILGAG